MHALVELVALDGVDFKVAAKRVGLSLNRARALWRDPKVVETFRREMDVVRGVERARSIHKLVELRDGAESERVQLEAARTLAAEPDARQVASLSVNVNVVPGYVIDLSGDAQSARVGRVPVTIEGETVDASTD